MTSYGGHPSETKYGVSEAYDAAAAAKGGSRSQAQGKFIRTMVGLIVLRNTRRGLRVTPPVPGVSGAAVFSSDEDTGPSTCGDGTERGTPVPLLVGDWGPKGPPWVHQEKVDPPPPPQCQRDRESYDEELTSERRCSHCSTLVTDYAFWPCALNKNGTLFRPCGILLCRGCFPPIGNDGRFRKLRRCMKCIEMSEAECYEDENSERTRLDSADLWEADVESADAASGAVDEGGEEEGEEEEDEEEEEKVHKQPTCSRVL